MTSMRITSGLRRALLVAAACGALSACENGPWLLAVSLDPELLVLPAGASAEVAAYGVWSDGEVLELAADWASSAPTVAAVAPLDTAANHATVTAVSDGEAVITARYYGWSKSVTVRVGP